ncbi:hypothetical protein F4814DRAFT_446818 [Daldinia grandis]|nr:hypothetical protein F4814DRAFT_446818 [Daldinia grandis]
MSDPNKPTPPVPSGYSVGTGGLFDHFYTTHTTETPTKPNTHQAMGTATPPTASSTPEKPSKAPSTPQAQTPRPPRTSSGSPPQGSPNLASPTPTAPARTTKPVLQPGSSHTQARSIFGSKPSTPSWPLHFGETQRSDLYGLFADQQAADGRFTGWGAGFGTTPLAPGMPAARACAGDDLQPTGFLGEPEPEPERVRVDREDVGEDMKWKAYAQAVRAYPIYKFDDREKVDGNEKKKTDEKKMDEKVDENKGN